MTDRTPGIEVRWLRWEDASEAILELRRRVYVEEQGFGMDVVASPRDPTALHLGALVDGTLVAAITAYLYEPGATDLAQFELPALDGLTMQVGKRMELAAHRGNGITEVLLAGLLRYTYECLRPARMFLVLRHVHRGLKNQYARMFDVELHAEIGAGDDSMVVMKIEGEARLRRLYLKMRAMAESALRRCPVRVPSLVQYLAVEGRDALLSTARETAENLYVAPLSLADELPRLSAQNRLLFAEQRPRLAATFPTAIPAPTPAAIPATTPAAIPATTPAATEASRPRLVDIGTGTGVYLSMVAREPALVNHLIKGIEPSPQLLAYARFAYPDIAFAEGSAYATGEADGSVDVVTANFVFIHLRNPDLALLELWRIVKPGGLLYVVDVNDSTFTGPTEIRSMIEAHHRHHEGDRTILATLPRRAAEFGFEPVAHHRTVVRNTGGVEPSFATNEVRLGRMGLWGMLAFMGQREEIDEAFQVAQEHYLGTDCEISLDVETQVFRKPIVHRG
ncbi:MAG TPA: class I SAM-dependent methyltransferase [Nannocystis sp.]